MSRSFFFRRINENLGIKFGRGNGPILRAVDAEVLREDPLNLDLRFGVPLRTGRTLAVVDPLGDMRMVVDGAIGNTLQIGSTLYASR